LGEDLALSPEGRVQAACTARFLADQPITAAFASPLQRALETATIIAQPHAVTPTPVAALREVDVGRWEGRSWVEIERAEPTAYHRFVSDPAHHGYAGGENFLQVQQRVLPVVMELMERQQGSLILIVGHNVVNRVLLASLLDVPLAKARGIDQDNCGVNVLRYRNGRAQVLTMNAAFHLV
jgi:broad specificity phosphatase PhoE